MILTGKTNEKDENHAGHTFRCLVESSMDELLCSLASKRISSVRDRTMAALTQTTFRTISARARLLLHSKPEDVDVEWKTNTKVDSVDFVAFANSEAGGAILLGIGERKGPNGEQLPVIHGCDISDDTKLKLVNKAIDCLPPIEIQVFAENCKAKPFLRVEIRSGKHEPYCTKSGIYSIRSNNRNAPLLSPA